MTVNIESIIGIMVGVAGLCSFAGNLVGNLLTRAKREASYITWSQFGNQISKYSTKEYVDLQITSLKAEIRGLRQDFRDMRMNHAFQPLGEDDE